jgi:hypothetical protein
MAEQNRTTSGGETISVELVLTGLLSRIYTISSPDLHVFFTCDSTPSPHTRAILLLVGKRRQGNEKDSFSRTSVNDDRRGSNNGFGSLLASPLVSSQIFLVMGAKGTASGRF